MELGGEIHISANVKRVVVSDGAATGLEVELVGHEPEIRKYDAVIATAPSYVFTRLVPSMPEEYQSRISAVKYLSAVLMILVLDRPLSSIYWMNVADRGLPFVGVIEHTNMIDKSLYGGRHIVYLSNYPSRESQLYQMTGEQLLEHCVPHLRKINPEFDSSWILEYHHHKVDGAQPIIGVNYRQRIPDHRTPIKNLYLANTTQIYPEDRGTNYSVCMGRRVARMVLEGRRGEVIHGPGANSLVTSCFSKAYSRPRCQRASGSMGPLHRAYGGRADRGRWAWPGRHKGNGRKGRLAPRGR